MKNAIVHHLELHLGSIAMGWQSGGEPMGVQVCQFLNQPFAGVHTYSTLGLSEHELVLPQERSVRQELVLAVYARSVNSDNKIPELLFHVADLVLQHHCALLRGQVIPLGGPLVSGSSCEALYVSSPVVFPDGFATCRLTQPPTVMAWLVPITNDEVAVIRESGWSRFEDKLEEQDPDLFDLLRRGCCTVRR